MQITVQDDIPAASPVVLHGQVDEDDLNAGVGLDNSTGIAAEGNGPADAVTDKHVFTAASLQTLASSGADEPATIGFVASFAAQSTVKNTLGQDVKSHGFVVKYAVDGAAVVGFADANGDGVWNGAEKEVFRLTQAPNGDIAFNLKDQIDHAPGSGDGGILQLNLSTVLQIKDFDGDIVPVGANALKVSVENDIPADTTATVTLNVEEDTVSTTAPAPADFTNGIPDADSVTDEDVLTDAMLQTLVLPGADEFAVFSLNTAVTGVLLTTDGEIVTSHGGTVRLGFDGTNVVGFVNGIGGGNTVYDAAFDRIVFQISATGGGNFKFDLRDKIDHIDDVTGLGGLGDNGTRVLDISRALLATDFDGDAVGLGLGSIMVSVENDIPSLVANVVASTLTVDETALNVNDTAVFTDFFTVNYGADGPGSINNYALGIAAGATGVFDTATGLEVVLYNNAGVIEGRINGPAGDIVFTVSVNTGTGVVTLDQQRAVEHGVDGPSATDHNDPTGLPANLITLSATITDFDGDAVQGVANIGAAISFRDDGPSIDANQAGLPALETDDTATDPGDSVSAAAFASLFTSNFGADGPKDAGHNGQDADAITYALSVSGANAASGVVDTLSGLPVVLNQIGQTIVGSVNGGATPVFTISVDANTGIVTLTQHRSVRHDNVNDPVETGSEATVLNGVANLVTLTATITDGDGDTDSASRDISGAFRFADDGPSLTIANVNLAFDGSFGNGFTLNGNLWGAGSGTATDVAGAWDIEPSPVGGSNENLERIGDGHRGAHSSTGSVMVDLEATPGNVELSQTISGLAAGGVYQLTFEVGQADDADTALLEVWWNGVQVGATINPNPGNTQTITLNVTAGPGLTNTVTFREVGAVDSTGTYLANVKLSDIIVIDETAGLQDDDTTSLSVSGLFAGVVGGVDPDMVAQFAQGSGPIVSASAIFGADGPAAGGALTYALTIASNGTPSGLETTSGQPISLFTDANGRILGLYDSNGVGGITLADAAAFAIHIGPTGVVSVAQYVSLEHPNGLDPDDGITVALNSVKVTVTATDGDGDTAVQSADISGRIRFDDDGPSAAAHVASAILDDEAQPFGIDGDAPVGDLGGVNVKTVSGDLAVAGGADGIKSISFENGISVTNSANGAETLEVIYVDPVTKHPTIESVSQTWVPDGLGGGTLYGLTTGPGSHYATTANPAFTLTVDAAGHHTFTANTPLNHPFIDADYNNDPGRLPVGRRADAQLHLQGHRRRQRHRHIDAEHHRR